MRASIPVDLSEALGAVPALRWEHGPERTFREEDIAAVRGYDLDFILYCSDGAPRGEILRAPRYGVWAFYHGNQGADRRSPPCFWEVYRDTAVVQAALLRIDGRAGGTVLRKGTFKTVGYSYVRTCEQVQAGAAHWPAQVCGDMQGGAAPALGAARSATLAARGAPSDRRVAHLLVKLGWRFGRAAIHRLARCEQWNIGIVEAPIHTFLSPGARPPVRWLPDPAPGTFLADPFGVETDAGDVILVEQFEQRTGKGHIAVLEPRTTGTYSPPQPIIEAPTHLSYPYLVRHREEIYCIPESGAAGEVAIYKALAFPRRWVKHATLIRDFAAKDATVFQYEGLWWLLCSEARHAQNNTLYAWYAADLFGPWVPHPANPLKLDIRSSRPAGTPFVHEGQLYRPAQDCSRGYGGAITINRVARLTPTAFEEEPAVTIEPYAHGRYPLGLHTLSAVGQRTIIDGKRERYCWRGAVAALQRACRAAPWRRQRRTV